MTLRQRRLLLGLAGMLAVVLIWLPRGFDLDRLVSPDEPFWLARSANFAKGLSDGNFRQTYQYAHPGVTTMWAGTIGYLLDAPKYLSDGPESIGQRDNEIAGVLQDLGFEPIDTMAAGRLVMTVIISIALAGTAWYAVRLFGLWPGLFGATILVTDPYHIALTRLLHVDGMLSTMLILAAVAWLGYLKDGYRWRDLFVAGVAVALAGLTRSLAIVLLPMILVSAVIERGDGPWLKEAAKGIGRAAMLGAIAAVSFVALWPAMWVAPISTVRRLIRDGTKLGESAHNRPIFFNGRIYDGTDPGLLFYPISFLWRTTPVMLVGLACAAVAGGFGLYALIKRRREPGPGRWAAYLTMLAGTVFVLLELSAKKLDRYIIPVVPPLALVAGWGAFVAFRALVPRLRAHRIAFASYVVPVICAFLIGANLVSVVATHPYGLDYYNPLVGGGSTAEGKLMIGWGEGQDEIGATINALPDDESSRILTTSWRTSVNYFIGDHPIFQVDFTKPTSSFNDWLSGDYVLWYITSDQRGYIPADLQAYFAALTPVQVVQLSGIRYAALYDIRTAPLPQWVIDRSWMVEIAPGLRLMTAKVNSDPVLAGNQVTALMFFTGPVPDGVSPTVQLSLTGPNGEVIESKPQSVRGEDGETIWSLRRRITVPETAEPGTYWVTARFVAGSTVNDVVLGSVEVVTADIPLTPTPTTADDDNG